MTNFSALFVLVFGYLTVYDFIVPNPNPINRFDEFIPTIGCKALTILTELKIRFFINSQFLNFIIFTLLFQTINSPIIKILPLKNYFKPTKYQPKYKQVFYSQKNSINFINENPNISIHLILLHFALSFYQHHLPKLFATI